MSDNPLLKHLRDTFEYNRNLRAERRFLRHRRMSRQELAESKEWIEQVTKDYSENKRELEESINRCRA